MITQIVASNTEEEMNDFFVENVEKIAFYISRIGHHGLVMAHNKIMVVIHHWSCDSITINFLPLDIIKQPP